MNTENKENNVCHDGLCASCAIGMGCDKCNNGHHHKHLLKILIKILIFIFVVSVAFKMGEVKGLLERSHMYRQYGNPREGMMGGYKFNNIQPTQNTPVTQPETPESK